MPFVSSKQRAFFNANKSILESKGVDVDEYNTASKGLSLPQTAPKKTTKLKIKKPSNGNS